MTKITFLIVLLFATVSVGSAQEQKRVTISSMPNIKVSTQLAKSPDVATALGFSSNLPVITKSNSGVNTPIMPTYLTTSELVRKVYAAPVDDSGWIIASKIPGRFAMLGHHEIVLGNQTERAVRLYFFCFHLFCILSSPNVLDACQCSTSVL